ncbi:MAG TPA: RdgB/HAM1 family non-canonical purine NTP pyrophosphatase [Actinomycetota bacterium]|nr:RdgB/HAM1 family non-canonical purine NTP pyrophosphatase [Actinomycetota bacterium]
MTHIPDRLVVASRNPGKVREILEICADWPVEWLTFEQVSWPEVAETGTTYMENAVLKAQKVAEATGQAALADDSGLEVDALGGAPGPRSARYAGNDAGDEQNLRALIRAVAGVPRPGRTARYRAVAVLAWPDGRHVWAEGECEGLLRTKARGSGGFGYDPIFEPIGWERTMAELTLQEKNRISHRGRALGALREILAWRNGNARTSVE